MDIVPAAKAGPGELYQIWLDMSGERDWSMEPRDRRMLGGLLADGYSAGQIVVAMLRAGVHSLVGFDKAVAELAPPKLVADLMYLQWLGIKEFPALVYDYIDTMEPQGLPIANLEIKERSRAATEQWVQKTMGDFTVRSRTKPAQRRPQTAGRAPAPAPKRIDYRGFFDQ